MTLRRVAPIAAVAAAVAGCAGQASAPATAPPRLTTLERAFAARAADPAAAADLFGDAGPGTVLERARIAAWLDALERAPDRPDRWRRLLAAEPGRRATAVATLSLADALAAGSEPDAARAVLVSAPVSVRTEADLRLIELGGPEVAGPAARRLAVAAPDRLRESSRSLERSILGELGRRDRLHRAAAWRRAGLGSRGAAELRRLRWQGAEEVERRLELARCELDAGSTTRVLNAVAPFGSDTPEAVVLRAEAWRLRGWRRAPDRAARRLFSRCLREARQAVDSSRGPPPTRALELIVECGTEAGELGAALDAWRRLEASSWGEARRSWLGRRLGVALAMDGAPADGIDELAGALESHERAIRFWRWRDDTAELDALADVRVADVYGRWARSSSGRGRDPDRPIGRPPVGADEPPRSVSWLLEHAGPADASDEWQRLLRDRRPTLPEALAAAGLAARAGRANTAIRTLLRALPDLGSEGIADAPVDLARAYLPLGWTDEITAAARDTGLEPWLIAAVARQESTFTAHARSPAGAVGVLQLLPSTARGHARTLGLGSRPNLTEPAVNIRIGSRELARLVRRFDELEPALAAYNGGETRVRRWWRRWPEPELFTESIPIPETYNYVRRVVFLADAYRQIHSDVWSSTP